MKIIYSAQFTRAKLALKTVLISNGSKTFNDSQAVSGFSLLDCTGTVTVEASNDGFLSTLYSAVHTGSVIINIGSTITTATQWRITADASGAEFKLFYPGQFIDIQEPAYPYGFLKTVLTTDRQTQGGVKYSKIHGNTRAGQWQFKNISAIDDLINWNNWFDATNGFRQGFIVEEALTNEIIIIKAPTATHPLTHTRPGLMNGTLSAQEMQ